MTLLDMELEGFKSFTKRAISFKNSRTLAKFRLPSAANNSRSEPAARESKDKNHEFKICSVKTRLSSAALASWASAGKFSLGLELRGLENNWSISFLTASSDLV